LRAPPDWSAVVLAFARKFYTPPFLGLSSSWDAREALRVIESNGGRLLTVPPHELRYLEEHATQDAGGRLHLAPEVAQEGEELRAFRLSRADPDASHAAEDQGHDRWRSGSGPVDEDAPHESTQTAPRGAEDHSQPHSHER